MLRLGLLLCLLAGHARAEEIAVAQYGNAVNAFPYAPLRHRAGRKFFQQAGADITAVNAIGLNHVNDIMAVDRRLTGFDPNKDFQPRCRTGLGY